MLGKTYSHGSPLIFVPTTSSYYCLQIDEVPGDKPSPIESNTFCMWRVGDSKEHLHHSVLLHMKIGDNKFIMPDVNNSILSQNIFHQNRMKLVTHASGQPGSNFRISFVN